MTNFLQVPNELSSKKIRQINKNKWKTTIREISPRKAIISSLNSFNEEQLPVSIVAIKKLLPKIQDIDIAMIGADAYYIAYRLKKPQVFAILMKNI